MSLWQLSLCKVVLKPLWRFKLFQVCFPLKRNEMLATWSADGSYSKLAKLTLRQPSIILLSCCFASDSKVYFIRPKNALFERWLPISALSWSVTSYLRYGFQNRWLSDNSITTETLSTLTVGRHMSICPMQIKAYQGPWGQSVRLLVSGGLTIQEQDIHRIVHG